MCRENAPPGAGWLLVGAVVGLQIGVGLDSRRGEAIVFPPGRQAGRDHKPICDEPTQLIALDGQHRFAGCLQRTIGQSQHPAGSAGLLFYRMAPEVPYMFVCFKKKCANLLFLRKVCKFYLHFGLNMLHYS